MLFFALYCVFKGMEPPSFDSPGENDLAKSFPKSTNGFCVHLCWESNQRPPAWQAYARSKHSAAKAPYIFLLLKSNPIRHHSEALYRWGLRKRGKTGKHEKVGVNRKWRVLAQPPYSPQGSGKQSPRVEPWNQEDRQPGAEENPGS